MATTPRSYRKGSYTYTESAPGSNKFQNFTAAKPTVKKVRDDSRDKKAKATQPAPTISRNPYEKKADLPTISRNPYESSSKKAYPARQGGMDTAVPPQRKKYPNRQGGMDTQVYQKPKSEKIAAKYGRYDKMEQAQAYRKPVSDEYLKELERRIGASQSPLGGFSRWLMRTGDKLFGRY